MGMFELICPGCGAVNSVDASACACGHIFSAVTGSYEAAQLTLQEEEAYLEYIEARVAQLEYDMGFAESDVQHNPGNREKEQHLENIRNELAQLHAQYTQQTTKIAATKKVNKELRAQVEKEQAEARARAEAQAAKLKKEKEKAEALMRARKEAARLKEVEEKKKKLAEEKQKQKEAEARARAEAQRKIREALAKKEAEIAAKQKAAAARAKAEAEKRALIESEREALEEIVRKKKAEAERLLAEAERIKQENAAALAAADELRQRAAATRKRAMPKPGSYEAAQGLAGIARPEPELNAGSGLADAADEIQQPRTQECPICTAELPLDATSCRCGYQFQTSAADMPSLSTGEFFAPPQVDDKQEMQECPICTAEVPANAKKCKCGYQFAGADESTMPGLSLDGRLD